MCLTDFGLERSGHGRGSNPAADLSAAGGQRGHVLHIEAAQALARKLQEQSVASTRSRAEWAFESVLGRTPSPEEVDVLVRLYRSEFEHYRENPDAALALATQPLGPAPEGADPAKLAAWTVVGNALLNTDEFLTKR